LISTDKEPAQRVCLLFRGERVIYEVTREWVTWVWLCADCARTYPYPKKKIGETDQACDECVRRRQPARPSSPAPAPAFRLESPR
jgi:hypothetical protein